MEEHFATWLFVATNGTTWSPAVALSAACVTSLGPAHPVTRATLPQLCENLQPSRALFQTTTTTFNTNKCPDTHQPLNQPELLRIKLLKVINVAVSAAELALTSNWVQEEDVSRHDLAWPRSGPGFGPPYRKPGASPAAGSRRPPRAAPPGGPGGSVRREQSPRLQPPSPCWLR